jgi:hypothetical protein
MDGARDVLRLKIDTLNDDVIGKTSEILGLLFDGNVGERVIDTL